MQGLTSKELLQAHQEPDWRAKFADVVDLMELLRDCLIRDSYTIPDPMNNALALTDAGSDLKSRLIRKESVPAKEAHLMCALTLGHDELFVDVEETDLDQLAESISQQIRDGEIRFPFLYGRALYDAFAEAFEEEKDQLTNEETMTLLDATPLGLFQYGRFVVGPSGLRLSPFRRYLRASHRIPIYHCDDPVCRDLHSAIFSTGHGASINSERGKMERLLKKFPRPPADWAGLASEITRVNQSYFGNSWTAPIATLLGDCLSDDELSALGHDLSSKGEIPVFGGRASFLENVLVGFSDHSVAETLDSLVRSKLIVVPPGEIRAPVSTEHLRSGAFRLQPQLGACGVRFVSGDPGLPLLRERDLFRRIYLQAGEPERHELDWQLRGVDGVSIEVRLDEYLRTVPPPDALKRLVLSGSASAIAASELAGAGDFEGANDEEIIDRLLWKLGFDDRALEDLQAQFWQHQEELSAAVQNWLGTGPGDASTFQGLASVYFTELEGRLEDTLAFASWSLLNDHLKASIPFSYDPDVDRKVGLALLDEYYRSERVAHPNETLRFNGKLTLHPLIRGFGVLADVVESLKVRSGELQRPKSEYPAYASASALQTFPFRSVVPFLDVAEHSQIRIVESLRQIESTLMGAEVAKVRNEYSHYRRTSPEVAKMAVTLESVGLAIRLSENIGFGLNLFAPSGAVTDQWGRRTVTFAGPRSLSHGVRRPSSLQWAGLPPLDQNQFLVRSAAFEDANEVLRFTRRFSSEFSAMWSAYPKPRRSVSRAVEGSATE